jgi:nucleoside-diphosphate kinase
MTCGKNFPKALIMGGIFTAIALFGIAIWYIKFASKPVIQHTLAIIKPDAVAAGNSGKIIDKIEQSGFKIIAMKKLELTKEKAEEFYAAHKEQPFFSELVSFMISGPVVVLILEKENGIQEWRNLMGKAEIEGTLRNLFGTSVTKNAVHGSDSPETAKNEIKLFFPEL